MRESTPNDHGFVSPTSIPLGDCFRYRDELWMRAKPCGFINNSSVLKNVAERGDVFAVNLKNGAFTAWRSDALVAPVVVLLDVRS